MKNIVAIIPARKYDNILPDKNILPFGKSNLLIHKIRQLKQIERIDEIIVTSDDKEYLDLAKKEDVSVDFRPIIYSRLDSNFGDFVEYITSKVNGKHILWASPTSPFVEVDDYELGIDRYFEAIDKGYDSLITVNKIKRFLLDENGPLNFRFDASKRNSNALPTLYEFTNGIVLAPRLSMIKWKYNWGILPFKMELPKIKTVDICTLDDYEFAKFLQSTLR